MYLLSAREQTAIWQFVFFKRNTTHHNGRKGRHGLHGKMR
jgi:hypothetical protein